MSKDGLEQKGVGGPKLGQSEKAKQRQVRIVHAGEIKDLGGVEELGVKIEDLRLVFEKSSSKSTKDISMTSQSRQEVGLTATDGQEAVQTARSGRKACSER